MILVNRKSWSISYKIEKLFIFILVLSWLPLLRFGFDSHHDGLISATVNNLSLGSSGIGHWPFNQYGPAWFILLEAFSKNIDPSYFFLSLRVLTFIFYLVSFMVTYLLAKNYLSERSSLHVVIFLMLIQPFVSDYNSSMIPWPSALSMCLIPLSALILLKATDNTKIYFRVGLLFACSASVNIVTFTRVQVGLALMFVIFGLLALYKKWRLLWIFTLSLVAQLTIFLIYLQQMNWLNDVFSDVFKFGSLYLTGDKSTLPKPIWTIFITLALLLLIQAPKSIFINISWVYALLVLAISCLVLGVLVLLDRGLNPVQLLSVGFRRIWISLLIASLISMFVDEVLKLYRTRRLPSFPNLLLWFTAAVAALQIWPLFDQMHAWWSATPAVIVVFLVLKKYRAEKLFNFKLGLTTILIVLVLVSTYLVTFASSVSQPRIPLAVEGYSGILISDKDGIEISQVNQFLTRNIERDSSVLNICTNGDPFFSSESQVKSASRAFVFWTPMTLIGSLSEDILEANPDKIVTCSFVTNPIFYPEYREKQNRILNSFTNRYTVQDSLISPNGIKWVVYSR
jgi:hypothetical protein